MDLTDPQSWNGYAYVGNRPLTDTDPSGLQSCPAPCASYNPGTGQPSGNPAVAGGGFSGGFTLWQSSDAPPSVQTISAPNFPLQNTPFDAFIGAGKQAASDIVSGLSYLVNGDQPTEATRTLLWYLRPSTQRQQAGANSLAVLSILSLPRDAATIGFSSSRLARIARELEQGTTQVTVSSQSEAEELFLRLYQGDARGYRNTTGWTGKQVRDFYGSKSGTYHWDTIAGHGTLNPHGIAPHLQIHTHDGPIVRIFFGDGN